MLVENSQKPTASRAVLFGIIGGIIGSIAMIGPKMISNIQLEMPYNVNWIVFGIVFGAEQPNAFAIGLGMHIVTGIIIGAIFGIITGKITKLRINKISRGIVFGIITGLIVFGVFFIPMLQNVLAPNLMELMMGMNPNASPDMIKQKMQTKLPTVIQTSLGLHILFGAVLGVVTSSLTQRLQYQTKK